MKYVYIDLTSPIVSNTSDTQPVSSALLPPPPDWDPHIPETESEESINAVCDYYYSRLGGEDEIVTADATTWLLFLKETASIQNEDLCSKSYKTYVIVVRDEDPLIPEVVQTLTAMSDLCGGITNFCFKPKVRFLNYVVLNSRDELDAIKKQVEVEFKKELAMKKAAENAAAMIANTTYMYTNTNTSTKTKTENAQVTQQQQQQRQTQVADTDNTDKNEAASLFQTPPLLTPTRFQFPFASEIAPLDLTSVDFKDKIELEVGQNLL